MKKCNLSKFSGTPVGMNFLTFIDNGGSDVDGKVMREAFYSMAKPAAAPTAATTISLLKPITLAAPLNADGDGVANVPLELGAGTPEAPVGRWT